jgi:AcrR family transcriptional regulator
MEVQLKIPLNQAIFLRDPEENETGRSILTTGAKLMAELGLEEFTFRKLAAQINCTEANVYHYFKNKQRLLLYYTDLYWSWLDQQVYLMGLEFKDPVALLNEALMLLTTFPERTLQPGSIPADLLRVIVISDGHKVFHTKTVDSDNFLRLFKPYKDLCKRIVDIFQRIQPDYPFPHSLATTVLEMSHTLNFYKDHLPALTDFGRAPSSQPVHLYLHSLCYATLSIPNPTTPRP